MEKEIEEKLITFLEKDQGKGLERTYNIGWLFDLYDKRAVFHALALLEPILMARVQVNGYEKTFYSYFRYPSKHIPALAKYATQRNNGKLLSVLTTDSAQTPLDYRIQWTIPEVANEADVSALKKKMTSFLATHAQVEIINVYIKKAPAPLLLAQGIVPHPQIDRLRKILRFYKEKRSAEDLHFWVGEENYSILDQVTIWCMFKLSYLDFYRERNNAYPFLFTYPNELYQSYRPRTNMQLFRLPDSQTYQNKEDLAKLSLAHLPVVRYAKSMSGSLFYDEDRPEGICGRFYYYEPESETFLIYRQDKILRAFNKVDAYFKLYDLVKERDKNLTQELKREYYQVIKHTSGRNVELHRTGFLRKDLKYSAAEVYTLFDLEYADGSEAIPPGVLSGSEGERMYAGDVLGMYAAEDELDQVLCAAAKLLDYDIVYLENMVGSHQVVSEVLDVREDSFTHLLFKA